MTGTAPPCTKKRNPITSKRLAGATGCTPSEHQSGRPEAVDSQILVEALFNARQNYTRLPSPRPSLHATCSKGPCSARKMVASPTS